MTQIYLNDYKEDYEDYECNLSEYYYGGDEMSSKQLKWFIKHFKKDINEISSLNGNTLLMDLLEEEYNHFNRTQKIEFRKLIVYLIKNCNSSLTIKNKKGLNAIEIVNRNNSIQKSVINIVEKPLYRNWVYCNWVIE
jgi:hypothetical protein